MNPYTHDHGMAGCFFCLSQLVAFHLPADTFVLDWIANEENQ